MAQYWFPGDVRVMFDCSPDALGTPGEDSFWMNLHFDFLGSKGRLYLTQNDGYWYQSEGMSEPICGESSWDTQEETWALCIGTMMSYSDPLAVRLLYLTPKRQLDSLPWVEIERKLGQIFRERRVQDATFYDVADDGKLSRTT